jgi:hypothetical protein
MAVIEIAILAGLAVIVFYHTATHGRRGRRWGGF